MNTFLSRLPKYLQWGLLILEFLVVVYLVIVLSLLFVAGDRVLTSGGGDGPVEISLDLGIVGFDLPEEAYSFQSTAFGDADIVLEDVVGKISVVDPENVDLFLGVFRWPMAFFIVTCGVMITFIIEYLRQFFRNVNRGHSFESRTVFLLHRVGILVIGLEIAMTFAGSWIYQRISSFLRENLTVEGLVTTFQRPVEGALKLGFGPVELGINVPVILLGLMILAIGEAFRQGTLLKQENELTI